VLFGVGHVLGVIAAKPEPTDARKELSVTMKSASSPKGGPKPAAGSREEFAPVVPIILDISPQLSDDLDYDSLNEELSGLRRALYFDLGVPFPGINLRPNHQLTGLEYALVINEIPLSRGQLQTGQVLVRESPDNLRVLNIDSTTGRDFLPGVTSVWVKSADIPALDRAAVKYLDHPRIISYHLSLVLVRHASIFMGLQEAKYLLDKMEERAPDLVREISRLLPTQKLAEIFQRLVQEQISIRDLRSILEALIEWTPKEKDVIMLVEYVRGALKRQISYMHSSGLNLLPVILLDPQVEEVIRKSIRQTSSGAFLALAPDAAKAINANVGAVFKKYQGQPTRPVLLASLDIRRYVRRLLESDFYELPVVSFQEITPEITVQPVERIKI
ncbi:MAG: FHIPEP family type III secretion protein, partial [Deltaproteobacteria bacterium]|nr:FHIPEP family type III secretion protein [Deltaproteobacteria bacterium]